VGRKWQHFEIDTGNGRPVPNPKSGMKFGELKPNGFENLDFKCPEKLTLAILKSLLKK
jgi:hypothetical protein